MTNYTPTTEEVRNDYVTFYNSGACCDEHAAEVYDAAYDFDRWLARHDAEVAEAERERIITLLKSHIYRQTEYVCSCRIDDDYPATMSVDEWVEHICTYQGENK